jgi:tetratricopeptide (TPR) repeat protein
MAKKKKKTAAPKATGKTKTTKSATNRSKKSTPAARHTEAYESLLREYTQALELLHKREAAKAMEAFQKIAAAAGGAEPELADRARTYAGVCARKLAPPESMPETADGLYYRSIVHMNDGQLETASQLIERALQHDPAAARYLYVRASVRALQGSRENALEDLRQAVAGDAQFRFQASNDPDFDSLREDAAFLDLIEPSAAGA